jgi:hypothetical protein
MNAKLYNAALTALRASAMESMALIEIYLNNPSAIPDHSSLVAEIARHTRDLAESEGAMLTLQQYFGPKPQPQAPPAQPVEPTPPATISEEELKKRSPTYRKSTTAAKSRSKSSSSKSEKK